MPKLKTVFAGSPEFAASILAKLADTPYAPIAVYTQPDRPKGRGRKVVANPVKKLAEKLKLPVEQPENFRDAQAIETLADYQPDVLIVAAYGLILPEAVLNVPTFGGINVHASRLPRWRGAAPIERAMMAGDKETGVSIMQMERGLDTGPVHHETTVPIEPETNAAELEATLADVGTKALLEVLKRLNKVVDDPKKLAPPIPQDDELATYAQKLTREDRVIDWTRPADELARQIIALANRLPARVVVNECGVQFLNARWMQQSVLLEDATPAGTVLDISKDGLLIQCATDILQVTSLKVERGKGAILDPQSAMNGFKDLFYPGARFSV